MDDSSSRHTVANLSVDEPKATMVSGMDPSAAQRFPSSSHGAGSPSQEQWPVIPDRPSLLASLTRSATAELDSTSAEEAPSRPRRSRYTILGVLGEGGMGTVYRTKDDDLGRVVAMKVMSAGVQGRSSLVDRFVLEAQATGRMQHPNIVPVHDIGLTADGRLYFTMALVEGESLGQVVSRLAQRDEMARREYTFAHRVQILLQLCDALIYAHSLGVLHRDLKPDNVMLGTFGEVFVMDWGLAKLMDSSSGGPKSPGPVRPDTERGVVMGTPSYMSPEQTRGDSSRVNERSDVYALGALMYELFTLVPPHTGKSVVEILTSIQRGQIKPADHVRVRGQARVPVELSNILNKALALDPQQRYPSIGAMRREIQDYVEGQSPVVCPHTALKSVINRALRAVDEHAEWILRGLVATATAMVVGLWAWMFL